LNNWFYVRCTLIGVNFKKQDASVFVNEIKNIKLFVARGNKGIKNKRITAINLLLNCRNLTSRDVKKCIYYRRFDSE